MSAPPDDTALIELCERYATALEHAADLSNRADAASTAAGRLRRQISATPPQTVLGLRALASGLMTGGPLDEMEAALVEAVLMLTGDVP